jgi:hypothetical protein
VELDSERIRVSHDGRKVGIASFPTTGGEITVVVGPKTDTLRLKALFAALGEDKLGGNQVRFERASWVTPTVRDESDFTPAFLLNLLQEITVLSTQLFGGPGRKRVAIIHGGVKGRPLLQKSITNQVLARSQTFLCEVIDSDSLLEYKLAILATAKDLVRPLREWEHLLSAGGEDPFSKWKTIAARFQLRDQSSFSLGMLYKLCRPPFPYGLRVILYKCLRYWQWKGAYQVANKNLDETGFWGMFVNLDSVFETYVGRVWTTALKDFQWERPTYYYRLEKLEDEDAGGERAIRPDHLFLNSRKKTLLVIDAKYTTEGGTRNQVFQMVSYLDYSYPNIDESYSRIGAIVFPGANWKVKRVKGFGKQIYVIEMPIERKSLEPRIEEFIEAASI